MNEHFQTGRDRAIRRGANVVLLRPPLPEERRWHMLQTHRGTERMQWRPGIDVWHDERGARHTAAYAGQCNWKYISVAADQTGGAP